MSKPRLEILFDDLETNKYECTTDKIVGICRNDYNQLLKQAGIPENAKTYMDYLLGHVEYRRFPLASRYVNQAREEYKNLLVRISKLNETKQIQQQANATHFLQNKIPQQNEGSGSTVHDHQRNQIPYTTHINTGHATQNIMLGSNDRPVNRVKVNQWVAPTTDLNRSNHETSCPPSQSVQGDTILTDRGDDFNHGTTFTRPNNTAENELVSKSYDNIKKFSKNSKHMLEDCLTATEIQKKQQDTLNNQSRINLSGNSEPVTVIHHNNNQSTGSKITSTKTFYPGGAVPLNTTTTNTLNLTDTSQRHVQNDDRTHNERQTKNMGQTIAPNLPPRTSHNAYIESEEAKLSRSRAASAQLKRNNPNIVDLSDSNRPTKLAEKFAEMYDNEWTEAFECLETHCKQQEKSIIGLLLDIVTKAYTFSKTETTRIVKIMEHAFDSVLEHGTVVNCDSKAQSKERKCDTNMLEQYLKDNAARVVPRLQKDFCKVNLPQICRNFFLNSLPLPQCSPIITYASRCVELTWWMCVQDPPIYMDTADSTSMPVFNVATYRAYTKTGRNIDYYVWPAILLEKGGAVLMKGVAQCV